MPKVLLDRIKTFSQLYEIPDSEVERLGFFDITPAIDSPLYIDSKLLSDDVCFGFIGAETLLKNQFSTIVRLIAQIKEQNSNDVFWRAADKFLSFTEMQGTCLGYSFEDIRGKGVGQKTRRVIISNIKQLTSKGYIEPDLMNLLCVFTEGFGCDLASDLVTFLIKDVIFEYNELLIEQMGLKNQAMVRYMGRILLENPFRKETPIILLPKAILSNLPVCHSFEDIENASILNEIARQDLETFIDTNKASRKESIFEYLLNNTSALDELLKVYDESVGQTYDYEKDPLCLIKYKEILKEFYDNYRDCFVSNIESFGLNVKQTAAECIRIFKHLIEDCGGRNQINKFDEKGIQLLFLATSYHICKANRVIVSPEVNYGSGPVDFLLTKDNVLVSIEIKKSSNTSYKHGLEVQLPKYMKSNESTYGYYLFVNLDNENSRKIVELYKIHNNMDDEFKNKIEVVIVQSDHQASASIL